MAADEVVLPSFLYKRGGGRISVQGEDENVTEEFKEFCIVNNLPLDVLPVFYSREILGLSTSHTATMRM